MPAKDGQPTLEQLDRYRYEEAPAEFGPRGGPQMQLDQVKTLVEWKLYVSAGTLILRTCCFLWHPLVMIGPADLPPDAMASFDQP